MASRIRYLIAAAVLVLGIVPTAAAQSGAVLTGVVRDRAGNPVPGVVLTIVDPSRPGARVVVTDQEGFYFVDRLHYGTPYAVDLSHPRFRKSRVEANANEGEAPVHITLQPRRHRLTTLALLPWRVLRLGFAAGPRPVVSGLSVRTR
jgi:hypothetical protein